MDDGVTDSYLAKLRELEGRRPRTFLEDQMSKRWAQEDRAIRRDLAEPDYRAAYAELAAQVRYLADDYALLLPVAFYEKLRALVGKWPHEVKP